MYGLPAIMYLPSCDGVSVCVTSSYLTRLVGVSRLSRPLTSSLPLLSRENVPVLTLYCVSAFGKRKLSVPLLPVTSLADSE